MPEGDVFKGEFGTGAENGPKEDEGGTEDHEGLPDEVPGGSPAENREVCISVVIISTATKADVFFELHRWNLGSQGLGAGSRAHCAPAARVGKSL